MYISGHFFYDFELLDMSGQISYDFDEKLLNFNNSRQIHAFLLFSIFFVLFPSFVIFFVCALQICRFRSTSFHFSAYLYPHHKKVDKRRKKNEKDRKEQKDVNLTRIVKI
jgi:hypothetical protein